MAQVKEILILTDFAAQMCLRAFQTINSSVDGHATCDNLVCVYNRREVAVPLKKKENDVEVVTEEKIVVFTVGIHHVLGGTMSKGKQNDHAFHNVAQMPL